MVGAQIARPVDQNQARRAAHIISRHCFWQMPWPRRVNGNRKGNFVLVEKGRQGDRRHGVMMFENRMQADDRNLVFRKRILNQFGERKSMRNAARAERLKRP